MPREPRPQPLDRRVEDVDPLLATLVVVPRAAGRRMHGPACGQPSARRASSRSTGGNRSRSTAQGITGAPRAPRLSAMTGATAIGWVRRATSRDTRRCHGTHASLPWNVVTTGAGAESAATAPDRP